MWNLTLEIASYFQTSWKYASLSPMRVSARRLWVCLNISTTWWLDSSHRWLKGHCTETFGPHPLRWRWSAYRWTVLVVVAVFKNASLLLQFKEKQASCLFEIQVRNPSFAITKQKREQPPTPPRKPRDFSYWLGNRTWPTGAWHFIPLRINIYTFHCKNINGFDYWMLPTLGDMSHVTFLKSEKF